VGASLQLYALEPGTLAQALAGGLGVALSPFEDRAFEDGEHKWRPLCDPAGSDAYVLAGLHGDTHASPHDRLCRLLMFLATLRDHGATRVTALVPYLAYARKDQQTQPFDPLSLRYVAQLFEAVGTQQMVVLEAHNPAALQNAFRCPVRHLAGHSAMASAVACLVGTEALAVASPDPGGARRARLWQESLALSLGRPVRFALVDKRRSAGVQRAAAAVAGDVQGMTVLLLDDLIASGQTLQRAAQALRLAGARRVFACATHGLFVGEAAQALAGDSIERILVTDSVPADRLPLDAPLRAKLQVLSAAPLFMKAVQASRNSQE
jgi:ribose-phosphate pyrophosphokinase